MDAPDNDDAISLPSDAASLPSDALSLRSEVVDPSLPSDKDSEPSRDDVPAPPQRHSCKIACGCGAKVLQKPIQAQSATERFDLAFSAVRQHVKSQKRRYSIGAQKCLQTFLCEVPCYLQRHVAAVHQGSTGWTHHQTKPCTQASGLSDSENDIIGRVVLAVVSRIG